MNYDVYLDVNIRSRLLSEVYTVTFKLIDTVSNLVFCPRKFLGSLVLIDFSFG